MQTARPARKIGLMGFFGYGNLGDAALQEAMIQHVKMHLPEAEIFGFSLDPDDTEARHGIKSYPISRTITSVDDLNGRKPSYRLAKWLGARKVPFLRKLDRWVIRIPMEMGMAKEAFQNLKGFDAVIVSGSGPLNDYWGGGGPMSFPYTLMKWGLIARLRKTKFLFVSVGAGPIYSGLSQLFIRFALSLAHYCSVRDDFSYQLLRTIGFNGELKIYPDLAHSLHIGLEPSAIERTGRPIVGIGPMGYFKGECWPEDDPALYADYLDKMVAFVTWLIDKEYDVLFLPGEAHFDQLVIEDLIDEIKKKNNSKVENHILRPYIQTLDQLLANLLITDYVIASRFHNVLLGQLLSKPVIALSYQEKIDALMTDTGQGDFCLSIGDFKFEKLKDCFTLLEANNEAITGQVSKKTEEYKKRLAEQYENIFQDL